MSFQEDIQIGLTWKKRLDSISQSVASISKNKRNYVDKALFKHLLSYVG
jgi:hypothetical protein